MFLNVTKLEEPDLKQYAKFFNLAFNCWNPFMDSPEIKPMQINSSLSNPMGTFDVKPGSNVHSGSNSNASTNATLNNSFLNPAYLSKQQANYSSPMSVRQELRVILAKHETERNQEDALNYEKMKELALKNPYDFDKDILLQAQTVYQQYKLSEEIDQTTPVKISVKCVDFSVPPENFQFQDHGGIDLICVVDVSGSMEGEKLQLVKKTLHYMVSLMKEYDRLALVVFNRGSKVLSQLKTLSEHNLTMFKEIINGIEAEGGTLIATGLDQALNLLKARKYKNPGTSVFLLSDGRDDKPQPSLEYIKHTLQNHGIKENFSVNTFGFGMDHDADFMREIAKTHGGNFYFVNDIKCVDQCFVAELGLLFSLILKDIEITVKVNNEPPLEEAKITKTYGDMWVNEESGLNKINVKSFAKGMQKDYICELTFPKLKLKPQTQIKDEKEIKKEEVKKEEEVKVDELKQEEEELKQKIIVENAKDMESDIKKEEETKNEDIKEEITKEEKKECQIEAVGNKNEEEKNQDKIVVVAKDEEKNQCHDDECKTIKEANSKTDTNDLVQKVAIKKIEDEEENKVQLEKKVSDTSRAQINARKQKHHPQPKLREPNINLLKSITKRSSNKGKHQFKFTSTKAVQNQKNNKIHKQLIVKKPISHLSLDPKNNKVVLIVNMIGKTIFDQIIQKEATLELNILGPEEKLAEQSMDDDVMANYLRVRTAEAIENAKNTANNGYYEKAHFMLLNMKKELEAKNYENYDSLIPLMEDLEKLISMFRDNFHSDKNQLYMSSFAHSHMYQQSCPMSRDGNSKATSSYLTPVQIAMSQNLQKANN